jgi:hypothetical protein
MHRNQPETEASELLADGSLEDTTVRMLSPELVELLMRAAQLAVEEGLDHEDFMRGAWVSYIESRPDFRAKLIEMQVMAELDEMRRSGRVPDA